MIVPDWIVLIIALAALLMSFWSVHIVWLSYRSTIRLHNLVVHWLKESRGK